MNLTNKLNLTNVPIRSGKGALVKALNPNRFTAMSGKMSAILGYLLGESWTEPEIRALHVTVDGFLLAQRNGDVGCNDFIGGIDEWDANLRRLFEVAETTIEEQQQFAKLWQNKVTDWQRES